MIANCRKINKSATFKITGKNFFFLLYFNKNILGEVNFSLGLVQMKSY